MISHQTPAPPPLITQPPTPLLPQISRTAFCLNPAKTVSFPHNPTSPDLPGSVWITSPQLPVQTTRTQIVFGCPVTNAGESRPPTPCAPPMTQPTPPAPPPDSSSPKNNAWSSELTGLHQTTEAVSLSLQALLEHLLAPTTPPMPPADVEQFVSAPSSGFLAPAAAEQFVSASGLGLSAPCSKLPCSALPDVYNGNSKAEEHFFQSCITYIQLSGKAFTSDALKFAWVLSYMKAGQASTYALYIFQCPEGVESFSSWTEFEKEFQVEFFPLDPAKTTALSL
ncbi:hypothetical protein E4T56_gene2674 [Termitomyces sp. T112]|nr:hypothetical protein E4T56_gene2674 [Termitomyces sp. T112]